MRKAWKQRIDRLMKYGLERIDRQKEYARAKPRRQRQYVYARAGGHDPDNTAGAYMTEYPVAISKRSRHKRSS